jgi:predicted aldo/keto reductase-like oxidoreductase
MSVSRRRFLESTAIAGFAGKALADKGQLPIHILGKTGAKVSLLAFGGGSRFLMHKPDEKAVEALNKALDLGITYVDTAQSYGNGESERLVGMVMKTRRKEVFLADKISNRDGSQTRRLVEESLRKLNTDHVDLLHIHSLGDPADLAAIEAKGGVLDQIRKLRDEKMTRFIGITCHQDPSVLKTALERHEFDCTQMALNAARAGQANLKQGSPPTPQGTSFEELALPVARRKKMGVIAMKVFGQEQLLGRGAGTQRLLYYSLSLDGVHVAVAGMPKMEHIEQNIAAARTFKPLPKDEMQRLAMSMSEAKFALDHFFADHIDA